MRSFLMTSLLAAPLLALAVARWSVPLALILMATSHALVLYATLRPNVQWLGPVITHFSAQEKEVWLTVDDGPTADTREVLDLFDAHQVKATFFVKGALAEKRPDLIQEMAHRGHGVANHSHTHPSGTFWCLPPSRIAGQIERCNQVLTEILGLRPTLFRAPVGTKNPAVHPILRRLGMTLIGWSARAFDTQTDDPELVVKRIMPDIAPGAIVLLHQGRDASVPMLLRVIEELGRAGYRFVIPSPERLKTKR